MRAFDERGRVLTEALQHNAGLDSRQDAFNAGYITCVKDLLNTSLDEVRVKER